MIMRLFLKTVYPVSDTIVREKQCVLLTTHRKKKIFLRCPSLNITSYVYCAAKAEANSEAQVIAH